MFVGTLDAALLALDSRTGALLWEIQMADPMQGFSITSPPLPLEDRIIAGIAGGEFGIRGFVDAYDPATGARLWRFSTIPGPGEFGHDTWAGDSWRLGCGATWLPGSYDPELHLLYWAVGNPCPLYNGPVREGDNLFTSSVVALDPATGQRQWHFQFSPHDTHDWDANQDMMLVDRTYHGAPRKLLLHADRNGHFYVLDRSNGKFLAATPFTAQTWNSGFDANGRPIAAAASEPSAAGNVVAPSIGGGTNFQAPSYSPATGLIYLAYQEGGQRYISETQRFEPGQQYPGGRGAASGQARTAGIKAIDPESGKTVWSFALTQGSLTAGVLATAGGVVFAASREGYLFALDARTGASLWRFQTGAAIDASPISYAVAGKQFVAIAAGNVCSVLRCQNEALAPCGRRRSCAPGGPGGRAGTDAPYSPDLVQLEDAAHGIVVAIAPSAGNLTREMTVKGHNILGPLGIPFLGPWANRLDEQAFYANGKHYALNMELGNVRGAHPIHGFLTPRCGRSSKWGPTAGRRGSPAGSSSSGSPIGWRSFRSPTRWT